MKSTITITGLGYNYNCKYDYNYNYRPSKIAVTGHAITHTNQEEGDLGGQWKAHPEIKLHGLISPTQNSK